jgi:lipoprotein-releasing system permease protein
VLSDVVVDTDRLDGFPMAPGEMVARIMASPAGPHVEAVSPTVESFAIIQFTWRGQTFTKPVRMIGVDPASRAAVGGFREYIYKDKDTQAPPTFDLDADALQKFDWNRRTRAARAAAQAPPPEAPPVAAAIPPGPGDIPPPDPPPEVPVRLHGVIPGWAISHFRYKNPETGEPVEEAALELGDDVTLTTVGANDLKPVWGTFIVASYLKTEMSEYDQSFVYVPLEQMQKIRGMGDRVTALQIKVKDYDRNKGLVVHELEKLFPYPGVHINTWEQHQGPLLAAIDVERGILNLLLFMIVGVAGFSILAIFTMIVTEMFRDIGIMKSLGASSRGVMTIFLGYGLLLGVVGCGLGTGSGLLITHYINEIEKFLTWATGHAVFPREVYYFKDIPTNVDEVNVALVNLGAVAIAVVFSVLPAYRAARLHPVRALRFE